MTQGANLIGHTVVYQPTGATTTSQGVVNSINVQNGTLNLVVQGTNVPISQLQGIVKVTVAQGKQQPSLHQEFRNMDSSLSIGVSGLQANQQMLDVVGNNLANLNTTGFKSQQVNFSDLVYQTLRPAAVSATGSATNPMQIGQGVAHLVEHGPVAGTLTRHGQSSSILALQGNGSFLRRQQWNPEPLHPRRLFFRESGTTFSSIPTAILSSGYGTVGEASRDVTGISDGG